MILNDKWRNFNKLISWNEEIICDRKRSSSSTHTGRNTHVWLNETNAFSFDTKCEGVILCATMSSALIGRLPEKMSERMIRCVAHFLVDVVHVLAMTSNRSTKDFRFRDNQGKMQSWKRETIATRCQTESHLWRMVHTYGAQSNRGNDDCEMDCDSCVVKK